MNYKKHVNDVMKDETGCVVDEDGSPFLYELGTNHPFTRIVITFLKKRFPKIKVRSVEFTVTRPHYLMVEVDDSIVNFIDIEIKQIKEPRTTRTNGMIRINKADGYSDELVVKYLSAVRTGHGGLVGSYTLAREDKAI